jgi:hypothetical protein
VDHYRVDRDLDRRVIHPVGRSLISDTQQA